MFLSIKFHIEISVNTFQWQSELVNLALRNDITFAISQIHFPFFNTLAGHFYGLGVLNAARSVTIFVNEINAGKIKAT